MPEEKLLLTPRDRDVLQVLHAVRKGHLTPRQGAAQRKLTERWIREWAGRVEEKGDKALIPGLRGQPSQRRIAAKVEKRGVAIMAREYADFGPTLASEYLSQHHQITASRETVRQGRIGAGVWRRQRQRLEEVPVGRRRRNGFGEMVPWDTSDHDWLEGRGERL